jgi:small conductance mechanosensitive channel
MFSSEAWQQLNTKIIGLLPGIFTGIVVFILFWAGAVLLRGIVIRVGETRGIDRDLARFLGRAVRVAMLVFGAVTALGTAGVDVAALVAGLGLTGFALGFALKDVISNALAGVLIMIYKPFQHDDHITIKSFQGKVTQIDLRYTMLDSEGKTIFIPNSMLFTDAITVQNMEENAEQSPEIP